MSIQSAAAKADVDHTRIVEWEEGISQPTIRQAEILAKAYRRSFALLFLPDIPNDFQPLQDFRQQDAKELGTASIFIIRELRQKQAWIRNLYEESSNNALPFVGKFNTSHAPALVAEDMLSTLGIHPLRYSFANPMREWISRSEEKGIFISRTSFIHSRLKLDSDEMQGFAIADRLAPFVFINSDDWEAPQLFTLVHELAHIWIAESGISNEIDPGVKQRGKYHPVELFCNEVAANALMPAASMYELPASAFSSIGHVYSMAKRFGVSSFALLVRAFQLRLITADRYGRLKKQTAEAFEVYRQKEAAKELYKKKGGPDYFLLLVNKNGHLFTQVVMDAYAGGLIAPTEASNLLNTQVNNFNKLQDFLYK